MLARRRRLLLPFGLLLVVALLVGLAALVGGGLLYRKYGRDVTESPRIADAAEHFKYGSIGSEVSSGIPYWSWQAMPRLFPDEFRGRRDYAAFGFLYERDARGRQRDLPIGVSRRRYRGVDMVWFNCAVCHTGTWRPDAASRPRIVAGMPSNNLDFGGFVGFLLGKAAADPRLTPKNLVAAAEGAGADFNPAERLLWLNVVGPTLREGLLERSHLLMPLLERQAPWGPGRVDTFNPYKMIQMRTPIHRLGESERAGVSDFPSIFLQQPREGMQLHWDGNNTSLMERNLSAAIGAGVTPDTAEIDEIRRVSDWLLNLAPPPSPHRPDAAAVARGRRVYAGQCAACHGFRGKRGYVFQGSRLGRVTPLAIVGTDRGRFDSYTEGFRQEQLRNLFKGTRYAFRHFRKTEGYANQPLDGLWLRGPYLHNGSVPTLAALLEPPARRPVAFLRGLDVVDHRHGGFLSPACNASLPPPQAGATGKLLCFDTRLPGNGNGGHLWGTELAPPLKADLLAYLRTF
jgi:mono/diheme cytochrome c family protein